MIRSLKFAVLALACIALAPLVRAEVRTTAIEYKAGDVVLEGFLAWDDAKATEASPQPGVVVCPEWWGNDDYPRSRARKLAELGYVALAIDLYGKGKVTKDAKEAQAWSGEVLQKPELLRARARAGYDQLVAQPNVAKQRVAVIGYCMGGTVALELARSGADLVAVVAFHASKLASLGKPGADAPIRATVTICHGQADAFVTADEIAKFHAEMKAGKVDYQLASYAGAVHAFTNPAADAHGIPGVAYDAKADRRSWELMKDALSEAFAQVAKR